MCSAQKCPQPASFFFSQSNQLIAKSDESTEYSKASWKDRPAILNIVKVVVRTIQEGMKFLLWYQAWFWRCFIYIIVQVNHPLILERFCSSFPCKHTTCIPRWNDSETVLSTSLQRGTHVVCLQGCSHTYPEYYNPWCSDGFRLLRKSPMA